MRKVLGIVAEYNPFHNGHLYHLNESKRKANAEFSICVMSGNFTQRGNTSIVDKWSRAQMAIESGVDLVIELPLIYSISSAENFAFGSISILNKLGIVDDISFGSESGDISVLRAFADVLYEQPKEYLSLLEHELAKGVSFPKAREKAALMYLNDIRKYSNILSNPNNILGIEYLKALKRLNSQIQPMTIKREGVSHDGTSIVNGITSSTTIRKSIKKTDVLKQVVPESTFAILHDKLNHGQIVKSIASFEKEILYKLRTMSIAEISNLPDANEGLDHAIKNAVNSCNSIADLINLVKSKRYTQTRIQRILLYALLDITKQDMENSKRIIPYVRVLGFNSNGKKILSEIANPKLNIITSPKKFLEQSNNKLLKHMLLQDINASDIYTLAYDFDSKTGLDYTNGVVSI